MLNRYNYAPNESVVVDLPLKGNNLADHKGFVVSSAEWSALHYFAKEVKNFLLSAYFSFLVFFL